MILGIETSDLLCSVAFVNDGRTLAEYNHEIPRQHASLLGILVEKGVAFLDSSHLGDQESSNSIDLVAVALGPGSFTGLRIGLSYAQGFCAAGNIPIIGVSNHEVLAGYCPYGSETIYTIIDARRDEVYLARLVLNDDKYYDITSHDIVSKTKLADRIEERSIIIYDRNTILNEDVIGSLLKKQIIIIDSAKYSAAMTARIGGVKFKFKGSDNLSDLEPLYIRPFAGIQ